MTSRIQDLARRITSEVWEITQREHDVNQRGTRIPMPIYKAYRQRTGKTGHCRDHHAHNATPNTDTYQKRTGALLTDSPDTKRESHGCYTGYQCRLHSGEAHPSRVNPKIVRR